MPVFTIHRGNKVCVMDRSGKSFGCHDSQSEAEDQMQAINISMRQRGKKGKRRESSNTGN